ncbi:MAG: DNA-processing protein DprA [Lachnospiraceae bacterium]
MMYQDKYWFWLLNAPGITRQKAGKMLDVFREPEYIYYASSQELASFFKTDQQLERFMEWKDLKEVNRLYEKNQSLNIQFCHYHSINYPKKFKEIPDPPLGIYYKGTLPDDNQLSIAIIGARNCTRYGKEMAEYFGKELGKHNVQVVSGLARGIDGCAHRGALLGNGYTIGVLGGGIDQVYPKENYHLFMEMEQRGGIISESNIGIKPYSSLFPERNRLIAGLCDGILVVEAMEKSGTFITVDQGLDQGKDIFAIPGRILDEKSAGCNRLIKLGAHMVTDVSDILNYYHLSGVKDDNPNFCHYKEDVIEKMSLAPTDKMVYSCLQIEPKYLDDIIEEVNLAPQEVCKSLNHLVILGIITEIACNYYGIKIG